MGFISTEKLKQCIWKESEEQAVSVEEFLWCLKEEVGWGLLQTGFSGGFRQPILANSQPSRLKNYHLMALNSQE